MSHTLYSGLVVCTNMAGDTIVTVFDDGDECTLRRSSLCLQGARHFKESQVQPLCITIQ